MMPVIPDCDSPVAFTFAFAFIETQIMHSFTQFKFILFKKKNMIDLKFPQDVAVNYLVLSLNFPGE